VEESEDIWLDQRQDQNDQSAPALKEQRNLAFVAGFGIA